MNIEKFTRAYLNILFEDKKEEEDEDVEETEETKEEESALEIADDADFEEAMNAVIGKNVLVKFNYKNKDGESYEVKAVPYDMFENEKTGQKAIRAYLNGNEEEIRTYYIDSMGSQEEDEEDSEDIEEMMEE